MRNPSRWCHRVSRPAQTCVQPACLKLIAELLSRPAADGLEDRPDGAQLCLARGIERGAELFYASAPPVDGGPDAFGPSTWNKALHQFGDH